MLRILTSSDRKEWFQTLESIHTYDVYHLPSYHRIAEERGEGMARCFVYHDNQHVIALPLLIREIKGVSQARERDCQYFDATCVYGYTGPITSSPPPSSETVLRFHAALMESFLNLRLVTVFSRLHPLLTQDPLLDGVGRCKIAGETVSIDLTSPEAEQWAAYRRNHKSDIQRLREMGLTYFVDTRWEHYDEFVSMYRETMQRVHADKYYEFDESYFHGLKRGFGDRLHLCFCKYQDRLVSGGLVTICNGIIEFHLAATPNEFLSLAPMKLLFDSVRQWGVSIGARVLHLGGGVGSSADSLFHFKAGFSKTRNKFVTWQIVVQPDVNEMLIQQKCGTNSSTYELGNGRDYFPKYRDAPVNPEASRREAMTM